MMLAQRNLHPLLRGRRKLTAPILAQRLKELDHDKDYTKVLQEAHQTTYVVGFADGSYLIYRKEVRTWVAWDDKWQGEIDG